MTTSLHGTRARYVAGCRCSACRKADREYHRRYYHTVRKPEPEPDWEPRFMRPRRTTPRVRPIVDGPEHIATILPRVLQALGRAD